MNTPTDQPTPTPETEPCNLPPTGWICTRAKGHTGPCAAVPVAGPKTRIAELEAQLEEALRQLGEMASEMEDATVAHAIAENERDAAIAEREKLREALQGAHTHLLGLYSSAYSESEEGKCNAALLSTLKP